MSLSESRHVGQTFRDLTNLVEPIEQHCRRIPLTAQERIAQRDRHAGREGERTGGNRSGIHPCLDARLRRLLDERLQPFDRLGIGREARKTEYGGVPQEDFRERLADDGADEQTPVGQLPVGIRIARADLLRQLEGND